MDYIIWTFSEDEINRVVCLTNFIIFITRLVRWRAKMYLLQWNSLHQESILCFHCWTVLRLLAIQGLNLFPVWGITTQDETLSFTAIVNYKSNSLPFIESLFWSNYMHSASSWEGKNQLSHIFQKKKLRLNIGDKHLQRSPAGTEKSRTHKQISSVPRLVPLQLCSAVLVAPASKMPSSLKLFYVAKSMKKKESNWLPNTM